MNKNTILITAAYAILPLLIVACNNGNNTNIDKELADTDAKLAALDQKLYIMQQQTDSLVADSLPHDKRSVELSKEIARHRQGLSKLKAPKDSTRIKRFNKKIGSLSMDSMMNANKVKQYVINSRMDEFRAVYKEQDRLRARRDSLMKIKSR